VDGVVVLSGLLVLVGIVGIIVPILPGLLLVWGGVALWAVATGGAAAWVVLGAASAIAIAASVIKYVVPGRRLRESGVAWSTIAAGAALGVVGFFVVPVIGLPLGFVLGIYAAELSRAGAHEPAWRSTKQALVATGWSILIELAGGVLVAAVWIAGLLAT